MSKCIPPSNIKTKSKEDNNYQKRQFSEENYHEMTSGVNLEDIRGTLTEHGQILPHPKEFMPENGEPKFKPDMTIGVFGARRTGKTWLLTMLLYYMIHMYPIVYVFTNTKHNRWYEQYLNPDFIVKGYRQDIMQMILESQMKKITAWRDGKRINPFVLIVWDDCLPANMEYDELFKELYFFGRHYGIGGIMNSQWYRAVPKRYRGNMDWVFSMKQDMYTQMEALWEEMSGRRCDKQAFCDMLDNYTNDQGFMMWDQSDKKVPIMERMYYGKSFDPGIFFMGCSEYWKDNRKHLEKILSGDAREKARLTFDDTKFPIPSRYDLEMQQDRDDYMVEDKGEFASHEECKPIENSHRIKKKKKKYDINGTKEREPLYDTLH